MSYCFWNIKVVLGNSGLVNTLEEQVEVRRERSLGTFSAHVQVAGISGWTVECFIALNAAWGLAMSGLFLQILSWDFLPLKHVSRDLCEQSFFFFFLFCRCFSDSAAPDVSCASATPRFFLSSHCLRPQPVSRVWAASAEKTFVNSVVLEWFPTSQMVKVCSPGWGATGRQKIF